MIRVETKPYVGDQTYSYQGEQAEETTLSYILKMREHMQDMYKKVITGGAEPTFQIGSSTFTLKEWDEFLSRYDSVEEAIQVAMRDRCESEGTTAAKTCEAKTTNDADKAQAVLDPAATARKRSPADIKRLANPIRKVEEKEKYNPYWSMFWKGRV